MWISQQRKTKKIKIYPFYKKTEGNGEDIDVNFCDNDVLPEEWVEKKNLYEIVQKELSKLEDNFRLVIVLRYIRGKTYKEIASVCKCSLGTVSSRIYRALRKLKSKLLPLLDKIL